MNVSADSVLRAMTNDGSFRVVAARTTETVRSVVDSQGATNENARNLGELVTGAILVRETMAPKYRLQSLFRTRDERSQLVADTHPDGGTRGLLSLADDQTDLSVSEGTLEVMRTLYTGELHRGVVRLSSSTSFSQALMTYMAESEQVASMIAVACVGEGDAVQAAGGYIVQLLPEVDRGMLTIMTERLRDFERIDETLASLDARPRPLLNEILHGMPFTELDERPVSFKCRCDRVRVMSSLASLGRDELTSLLEEGHAIEMSCDYCNREYTINPAELKGLLDRS